MPEITLKGYNFYQYIARSQYYSSPLDGILVLLCAIYLKVRLRVIHKDGIWYSYENISEEADVTLIHIGGHKFRPTQVGTCTSIT